MENSAKSIFWFLVAVGIVAAVVVYQNPNYRNAVRTWFSGEGSEQNSILSAHKTAFDSEGLPVAGPANVGVAGKDP